MTQDGPCVIGEDGEVPPMPAEESRGTSQTGREGHRQVPGTWTRVPNLTLKMVLISPLGTRCRVCWCPPCRSALPRGNPSLPPASSTLAVGRGRGSQHLRCAAATKHSSTEQHGDGMHDEGAHRRPAAPSAGSQGGVWITSAGRSNRDSSRHLAADV